MQATPVEAAIAYDAAGADELVLLDITASSQARGIMLDIVEKVASQIFIPFTVGGGHPHRGGFYHASPCRCGQGFPSIRRHCTILS